MVFIIISVVLLCWFLVSVVLMFFVSLLNIQFCKSDYVGLVVICSCFGLVVVCWFVIGLFGIILFDIVKIWGNIKDVMIEVMSQMLLEWLMMMI